MGTRGDLSRSEGQDERGAPPLPLRSARSAGATVSRCARRAPCCSARVAPIPRAPAHRGRLPKSQTAIGADDDNRRSGPASALAASATGDIEHSACVMGAPSMSGGSNRVPHRRTGTARHPNSRPRTCRVLAQTRSAGAAIDNITPKHDAAARTITRVRAQTPGIGASSRLRAHSRTSALVSAPNAARVSRTVRVRHGRSSGCDDPFRFNRTDAPPLWRRLARSVRLPRRATVRSPRVLWPVAAPVVAEGAAGREARPARHAHVC